MTAKEELKQYRYKQNKVVEALEEYERFAERATKMTSVMSDMPKITGTGDKVGENASEMADISREYEERWISAEREKIKLEKNIDKVPEPYRTILHMRYVENMSLVEVASKLNYKSYTYACEEHGKALKLYEKTE